MLSLHMGYPKADALAPQSNPLDFRLKSRRPKLVQWFFGSSVRQDRSRLDEF